MSFRFWRRVRLAPGVTLNLSKSTACRWDRPARNIQSARAATGPLQG